MKTLKQIYDRSLGWMLSALLTLLGFSSCDHFLNDSDDPEIYMYGTPTASYTVKGKVTDAHGKGLPHIQVIIPQVEGIQAMRTNFVPDHTVTTDLIKDTLYTAENGEFKWRGGHFPTDTIRYEFQFHDVNPNDGIQYQSDTLKVDFVAKDLTGGDGAWLLGSAEKEIIVHMKEKGKEESHE